jgi:hypothetical protein
VRAVHFNTGQGVTACRRRTVAPLASWPIWSRVTCRACVNRGPRTQALVRDALRVLRFSRPADPRDGAAFDAVVLAIEEYLEHPPRT